MKKGIRAVLNHCTNFPDKLRGHILCPRGLNSWCRWKNCEEGVDIYKPKVNIPMWTYNVIKKDFDDLSDDFLLKKCIHMETQNYNEGLNNIIWSRCPKNFFL